MLDFMRKNAGAWTVKFILFAIIVVFTFWGVGSWQADRVNRVATVNGEPIPSEAYRTAYGRMLDRMRQQFGNNLNDDLLKMLNVEEQALNQLIDQKLLVGEARRLGLRVSDKELAAAIQSVPAFQVDGAFDLVRYQRVLDANRLTPETFEHDQKQAMMINKLRVMAAGGIAVSDLETREWYDFQNKQVAVDYARFQPGGFTEIQVSDDALAAYYDAHQTEYQTPPKVKVAYLRFGYDDFRKQISVTDADVSEYYRTHLSEFEKPKTVAARHILLKLDESAGDEDVEKVRRRAAEIAEKAKGGADFAELAKTYSEGPSGPNGGDLGTFKREDMVAPFADAAFAMAPGDISDPVRTRFGWHIIKVAAVNPAATVSEQDAADRIRGRLTAERAKQAAKEQAQKAYEISYEGEGLKSVADALAMPLKTAGPFDRQGTGSDVSSPQAFAAAAFGLGVGEISEVVETNTADYLMQLLEEIPAQPQPLADVRALVKGDLLAEKRKAQAKDAADKFLAAVNGGTDWAAALKAAGLTGKQTGLFKRNAAIPDIGYDRAMSEAAFSLSASKPLYDGVLTVNGDYYVIRFASEKLPENDQFEKEKDSLVDGLIQQRQAAAFQELVRQLRETAEITIADGFKNNR